MSYLASSTSSLQSTELIGQGEIRGEPQPWPQRQSSRTAPIHILDDDSLLHIFYLYRPAIFDGDEDDASHVSGGKGWVRERWWYKLTHVCQRWRNLIGLILGSASYLDLSLVCTYGTPVAEMLAHSPPLPLAIDYSASERDITADDEERITLTLEQHDRVCRVRLLMPVAKLQKLIMAILEEEYPILEYLIIAPSIVDKNTALVLPETLQVPHLRHLGLRGFSLPIGSRLLTTVGIVTLGLAMDHPSAYFQPSTLLHWISFMPQLETLLIHFDFPVPSRDVERQLMHAPIMTRVTLPNLRTLSFGGVNAYVEAFVCRITTPRLEKLTIRFYMQLTFSVPRLLQLMNTTENLRFNRVEFEFFRDVVSVKMYPREETNMYTFSTIVSCQHLDWQVSSVAQIFNPLSQMFSTVEYLTLKHEAHRLSSEEHNEVDRTQWRKLLRSFCNVKTLHVDDGLFKELSRCLRLDDGELPLELLPELQELTYSGSGDTGDALSSFIDDRQDAGRPVTLTRR